MLLRSLRIVAGGQDYPFNLPLFKGLTGLDFTAPITFFVGENGSGKSTLLEAIAVACDLPAVGGEALSLDHSLDAVRPLARTLKLAWQSKTRRGFFLRAEDFINFIRRIETSRRELEGELERVEVEYQGRSQMAKDLARMPMAGELSAIQYSYGNGLEVRSHGEGFLDLFQARLRPGGLYLLDEPETPLSPTRQLALMALLAQAVAEGSQFIIATHSPLLMALPGSVLLDFDQSPPRPARWDELEHVALTRDFLNNPGSFLKHLV